ncbi:Ig-like domain repeat protein [uncultured Methanobrevibacter sp.]|uniref:MSCRAMM family protein n=1 Tax=uncultured Methanobrevibacter sp. TaxID=253161 RepID=UPI003437D45F
MLILIVISSITFVSANGDVNATYNSVDDVIVENSYCEYSVGDGLNDEIYVNPSTNISVTPDGSQDKPYSSITDAIYNADDNSTIILMDGVYSSPEDVDIGITKNLVIKSLTGNVTIDGKGQNSFFNIFEGKNLSLENINFINGKTTSYSNYYGVIYNKGILTLNNVNFKKMNNFMGVIYNEGDLKVYNSKFSDCLSSNYADIIMNFGNCSVVNSKLIADPSNKYPAIYNFHNLFVNNSQTFGIYSNPDFDADVFESITMIVINSQVGALKCSNGTFIVNNTISSDGFRAENSVVNMTGVYFRTSGYSGISSIFNSNATIKSSYFDNSINMGSSNLNITYSVILGEIYGNGIYAANVSANYNWWGINKGPFIRYVKSDAKYWIVMTFECDESPISVGTDAEFRVTLNKYTDGESMAKLDNPSLLPQMTVKFESQNGKFIYSSGTLVNGTFSNYLKNNNESSIVYAVINSQRLRLVIGTGLTNYDWYVSPDGHNGFGDGSKDNPYKTLEYTISKALNGNTIYLLSGIYTNNWNSNLNIVKNLTIVGIGNNVTLSRENARNIFIIQEWGSLTLKNLNFTVNMKQYSDELIVVKGGNLTIFDSNFYDIRSEAIVLSGEGIQNKGNIYVDNITFKNIVGPLIQGGANITINNILAEKCSNIYTYRGYEAYNACFPVWNSITILNSTFKDITVGIVNLNPTFYSSSSILNGDLVGALTNKGYVYVDGCYFIENNFRPDDYYSSSRVGLNAGNDGYVNNCSFIKNKGTLFVGNRVNNSVFESNDICFVDAKLINNSYFFNNKNNAVSSSSSTYSSRGVASADEVYYSVFVGNKAAYGGALSDTKIIHYSVFLNNSATYEGDDIFVYNGEVDYSSNWWGSNQKPDENRVFVHIGTLTLDNWVIMSLDAVTNTHIVVALNKLIDNDGNIVNFDKILPSRNVYLSSDYGVISPTNGSLKNNKFDAYVIQNETSADFNVYAKIDNQVLDLTLRNNNTQLMMENVTFYGNNNIYEITLINVNGHRIFNQTLVVEITTPSGKKESFNVVTDEKGCAKFEVTYPVGTYTVNVYYAGNGYFEGCNNSAKIIVEPSVTYLISYNYTFYGKNVNFYAVLSNGQVGIANQLIKITIIDSKGTSRVAILTTDSTGRANAVLSLDVGKYTIKCEYAGDGWYLPSSSVSYVEIRPVNSTIDVPDVIFYGIGNEYQIILRDAHGTLIRGEYIKVVISRGNLSDTFTLQTDENGVASLTINYLPGTYKVHATYAGDNVYGPASGDGTIVVNKVLTVISGFHYIKIPLNGVYTVVLTDMFGHRVTNATVRLNLYQGTLLKTYTGVTDGNGEVTFRITQGEGTYLATFDFDGNTWYIESTGAATIVVDSKTALGEVSINATDFIQFYGEDKYFVISFNDTNAYSLYGKEIIVTISSGSWQKTYTVYTDLYGLARLQITLAPGLYNITYQYTNQYYGLFAKNSSTISVYRMPTTILASDVIMNVGEAKYYEIKILDARNAPVKNMQVMIDINGTKYNATTNNEGMARLLLDLGVGKYLVTYYIDSPYYIPSSGSSYILVVDSDKTSTDLKGEDVNGYDNESMNFTLILSDILDNPISYATVLVNVSTIDGEFIGTYKGVTLKDGRVVFSFNLDYGKYIVSAYYSGSNSYLGSYTVNYISIDSVSNTTKTILIAGDSSLGDSEDYYVLLIDENGTILPGKTIKFVIGNETYETLTDYLGKAYLDVILSPGFHEIKAIFDGDDTYKKSTVKTTLVISGNSTYLFALNCTKNYRNGTQFHVQLLDSYSKPLANRTIAITINGRTYNRTTDENGWATMNINLQPGEYEVLCAYYGPTESDNAFSKAMVKVLPTILADNLIKYYRNGSQFYVKIIDGAGKPIANTNVSMNINGVFYVRETNSEGIARLNINLLPGKYILTAHNPYDGLLRAFNITVLSTVEANDLVKYYHNDSQFYAKFLDDSGKPLANTDIKFNINGVFYTRQTNWEGVAKLTINLRPGDYILTAIHHNGLQVGSKVTVYPTLEGSDLTMNYHDGSKFKARLVDGTGRALANETITFNINGVFYHRVTDANGIATLNINLIVGKYIITSIYDDYATSNTVLVNKL